MSSKKSRNTNGQTMSVSTALSKYELNEKQLIAVEAIRNNKIVILRGKAGTAKTFTAVYASMKLLGEKQIRRIAVSRPLVTTEKMGFLPGGMDDKFDPFLYPIIDFFNKFGDNGSATFNFMVESGKIRRAPIAFMRGTTIEDELLIIDEAQNIAPDQMLMILTRIGKNGRIVITGDEEQSDLNYGSISGLDYAIALSNRLPYVQQITLNENMRDPVITEIVETWGKLRSVWLTPK